LNETASAAVCPSFPFVWDRSLFRALTNGWHA
jgi:hypothetical protein